MPQYFSSTPKRIAATPATTITSKKVARTRHKEIVAVFLLDDLLFAKEIEKKFYKCAVITPSRKLKPKTIDFIPGTSAPSPAIRR